MPAYKLKDITGVLPATVTPFDENENFDEKRMRAVVNFLIDAGLDGFYITGSTGESFLMSPEERQRVTDVVVDEVAGRVPVIAHIGAIGTHLSVRLAQGAQEAGVDAISSVPPFYWGFTPEQIVNFYRDITQSTDLPMVAYNVPLAGGALGFETIRKVAELEGVEGIKYTAPTHFELMRIKQEISPDFMIYSGADEMAMSGMAFGADGIIGSFYNIMPEIFIALYKAHKAGDMAEAKRLQEIGNAVIFFSLSHGPNAILKRAMAWQGVDAGYCRKPLDNYYTAEAEEELKVKFRQLKKDRNLTGVNFLDAI